jgi:A/G-specific adenine glycosylase
MNKALLRRRLLRWYDAHRRQMPWRESPSAYRTWISEIMLQQTQVATVIPYFERFTRRFPNVQSLARAQESSVLKLWAGLGYYSRARNLHRAAKEIVQAHSAKLPRTLDGLRGLPGIGPYTAGAIASIAFNQPTPLVDGNVARVFARLYKITGNVKSAKVLDDIWQRAAAQISGCQRPGDYNQALMELGATVCLPAPEAALCGACPLSSQCAAYARDQQDSLPNTGPKKEAVHLEWTALHIEDKGRLLLWQRSAKERFLRGHWGLPETRHLPRLDPGPRLALVRHSITHHRIRLDVRRAKWSGGRLPTEARWVPRSNMRNYLISNLWRKATLKKTP